MCDDEVEGNKQVKMPQPLLLSPNVSLSALEVIQLCRLLCNNSWQVNETRMVVDYQGLSLVWVSHCTLHLFLPPPCFLLLPLEEEEEEEEEEAEETRVSTKLRITIRIPS